MATINTGPTPVDSGTTSTTIGPLDRKPAPVSAAVDPTVPPARAVFNRPVDRAPDAVEPGPGLGTSSSSVPTVTLPISNIPTGELAPTGNQTGASTTVPTTKPVYIQVLANGVVVTSPTIALNFIGAGITVTQNGTEANITITGDGNVDLGNWAFTGNSIYNINGGSVNNSDLTHGQTAFLSLPANGNTAPISLLNYYGNVAIAAATGPGNTQTWTFNSSGNIVLPSNTSSINYANGQPYGGGAGLPLANGTSNINIATANGNVTVTAAGTNIWTFGSNGNLTFPDNSGSGWPINQQRFGMGNIGAWLDGSWTIGEFSGNSVSGQVGIRIDPGIEGNTGVNLPSQADSVTQPVQIYNTGGGGITLFTDYAGNTWTFGADGLLTLPGGYTKIGAQYGSDAILSSNVSFGVATQGNATTYMNWSDDVANTSVMAAIYVNDPTGNAGNISVRTGDIGNANVWKFVTNGSVIFPTLTVDIHNGGNQQAQTLQFGDDTQQAIITGPTPAANVNAQRLIIQGQRGAGTGEGGDVYVWAGDADTNGGDIKIYAGDADVSGSGGYINIDAGSGVDGGGQLSLTGGFSQSGGGGPVYISAGQGTTGGVVNINGGGASANAGGYVNIQGGYGQSDGGAVTIAGGGSALGLPGYGNVQITAGVSTWSFDNTGNLTLPTNTFTVNYANGTQVSLGGGGNTGNVTFNDQVVQGTGDEYGGSGLYLAPGTNSTANLQYLRVRGGDYPTHIHLDTGNNNYFDQYFGADFRYVKLEANGNILINADDDNGNSATWTFDYNGNFNLPSQGNIVGATPNNAGRLQWVGNSSGDGAGYTTLQLVPDDTLVNNDQYLIIDPTAPGHIHIRAGGTQDNSSADLFLGGENSHFKVNAGANNEVRISANSHGWVFGADSVLTVPGEGLIRSIGDVVTLQSYNVGTGNVQSVYLGSGGGLGFFDQDIGGNWLEIFKSGAEPQIRVPVGRGNLNVQTAEGINAYDWVFDNTGNLTLPSNSFAVNYANGTPVSLGGNYGDSNVATFLAAYGSNTVSTTGNISAGNFIGSGSNVDIVAGSYTWVLDNAGNLTLPGNTFAVNYANGTQVSLGGGSYGNADVSNFLANGFGSNTIVTTGNITGNTAGFAIGYRDIPQITFSANATAALTDAGKHFYSTTAGNLALTIPDNSNVALPTGATFTVVVNAAGNVLVNQGTGVSLYMAGSATTGNRVVGAYGLASVMKVAANTWVISGTGVY